jgi:hypothetical protein
MRGLARDDAFAVALATGSKPAALAGRALPIFGAAQGRLRALNFGGAIFYGLRFGVTARIQP